MAVSVEDVVANAVKALKLELVEVERAPRGLLRVFIDRPSGKGAVTVEDCADVSNQLTHQFAVEGIEYERLEVSSPGLDRVLKTAADFQRFMGQAVKVRLNTLVENRKRFEGEIADVVGETVVFLMNGDDDASSKPVKKATKSNAKSRSSSAPDVERKRITVALSQIEKARLVPDI
jgi:ribosome maturation factor RimP